MWHERGFFIDVHVDLKLKCLTHLFPLFDEDVFGRVLRWRGDIRDEIVTGRRFTDPADQFTVASNPNGKLVLMMAMMMIVVVLHSIHVSEVHFLISVASMSITIISITTVSGCARSARFTWRVSGCRWWYNSTTTSSTTCCISYKFLRYHCSSHYDLNREKNKKCH